MEKDYRKVRIKGNPTWSSGVSYWHIRQIVDKDPSQTPEQAYEKLVKWTALKLERYGHKRHKDRLKYLNENREGFVGVFGEVLGGR